MDLLKNILSPKAFNVLIIDFSKDQSISAFVVVNKKEWQITSEERFDKIESFCSNTRNQYPVLIHCKGKGVISRETELHPNLRDSLTVNGDKLDFYFHELHQKEAFVSMARKDKIDPVIDVLESNNWIVYNLSIGPFILTSISEYGIIKNDYVIDVKDSQIQLFVKREEVVSVKAKLNNEKEYAISAVNILKDKKEWVFPLDSKKLTASRKEASEKRKFVLFGGFILTFFLIFLLSNYFYQAHINQVNADLEGEISVYGGNLSQIEQLSSEINRKKELISSSAVSSASYLSFYIDEIVCSVPSGIKLDYLDVYPLVDKLKQKRRINLEESIQVEGVVNDSRVMDNWVLDLEKLPWTSKIQIVNFSRTKNSKAQFEIKIFIAE